MEQRRHPRVELLALVELTVGAGVVILTVRNICGGGIFVHNYGHDLSTLAVGSIRELTIFPPGDFERDLVVRARLVRHDTDGIASAFGEDLSAVRLASFAPALFTNEAVG